MNKEIDFVPQVIVQESANSSKLTVNFRVSAVGDTEIPLGLEEVFSALEDWTAFCIASITKTSYLATVGKKIFADKIKK